MYVIDVIPLSRTAPGVLSYRSKVEMPVGSIVEVMLRKTATQGIVVSSLPVQDAKAMIKRAHFLLAKSAPSPSGILPSALMTAAKQTAEYHATSVGSVLAALFSEHIRAGVELGSLTLSNGTGYELQTVEKPFTERLREYEKRIDECKERSEAVLLVVPTIAECRFWKDALSKHKPLVLSGSLSLQKREALLPAAAHHVGLIIATPPFSWVPIQNLGAIIVDRVSAGTYTLPKRPYVHVVRALEALAISRQLPYVLGDFPIPLEYRPNPTVPLTEPVRTIECIDARTNKDDDIQAVSDGPWRALPSDVLQRIRMELAEGGRVVLLTARTGYAPVVVCKDCGQSVVDERGMPLTFSMHDGQRIFRSSDGKTVIDVQKEKPACTRCGSWNLLPLGVGQERVVEELLAEFPNVPITSVTADSLKSLRAARAALQEASRPGSITVATEAFLPWLMQSSSAERKPLGIIASADSLLSLPFWRSRERFVRLAFLFNALTHKLLLVTRHPDDEAVQVVCKPATSTFFAEEAGLRKALGYPPFGTLITLSFAGSAYALEGMEEKIRSSLLSYTSTTMPRNPIRKDLYQSTIVVSIPEGVWPDYELSNVLESLPPSVRVRIDPETLW